MRVVDQLGLPRDGWTQLGEPSGVTGGKAIVTQKCDFQLFMWLCQCLKVAEWFFSFNKANAHSFNLEQVSIINNFHYEFTEDFTSGQ